MVLEVVILNVMPGNEVEFEAAFQEAKEIIKVSKGDISHQFQKCIEKKNKYILLVSWQTIEDHTDGFRKGESYKEWKELLHHFYDPFPTVEHYLMK
jgi:heme-degrading monooxygenase HmoA